MTRSGRSAVAQVVPLVFLLAMTVWALILNLRDFVDRGDWLLAPLDAIILVLAVWLVVEAVLGMRKARTGGFDARDDEAAGVVRTDPSARR